MNSAASTGRTHGSSDQQCEIEKNPCQHGAVHTWLVKLMQRRSVKIAAIALANKIARIAWAMMARN